MDTNTLAEEILQKVGGESNIRTVTHCATRLRIQVEDKSVIKKKEIESLDGVLGTIENAGVFQIIIGTKVETVYRSFISLLSEGKAEGVVDDDGRPLDVKEKNSLFDRFLATVVAIFSPYIPLFCVYGIISGTIQVLSSIGWMDVTGSTYAIFSAMSSSVINFFPILLGFTAAKRFNGNPYIGAVVGGVLVHPALAEIFVNGASFEYLGLTVTGVSYASTVLPIIAAMFVMSKMELFLKKRLPKNLEFLLVPIVDIVVTISLTIFIIGPVMNGVANVFLSAYEFLQNTNLIFFTVICGAFYIFLIMVGCHWVLFPFQLTFLATTGIDYCFPAASTAIYALIGISMGVALFTKDKKQKQVAISAATVDLISGISEPCLYGVIMKDKIYMIILALSGAIGGFITGIFNCYSYNIANSGVLSIAGYLSMPNLIPYVIACIIAVTISFGLTAIYVRKRERNA